MAHVVSFRSNKFDVSAETPNPINPIAGQSVLTWLRAELAKAQYTATEPDTEDWGWYIDVTGNDGAISSAPVQTLTARRQTSSGTKCLDETRCWPMILWRR